MYTVLGISFLLALFVAYKRGQTVGSSQGKSESYLLSKSCWIGVFEDREREITLLQAPGGKVVRFSGIFTRADQPLRPGQRYMPARFGDDIVGNLGGVVLCVA